ncbi:MAG TPA: glycosyltransferase [Acidimicrobiales bacterium]|nr:glycosyltransferase [Acidimicrobiales bacterium]
MRGSLSLVVPVYNEQERVSETANQLLDFVRRWGPGSELLYVDDGSTDRSVAVIEATLAAHHDVTARVIRRPHAGKGAAVRAGLDQGTGELRAFCDVDLSTPLDQLEEVINAATMSPVLAIGSRDAATSNVVRAQSRVREAMGKSYNRVVQLVLAPGIVDTQCGAKAARADVWKSILPWCEEDGFAWDVEAVAIARRLGFVVREVAIEWHHDDRSRVRVGQDGMRMLWALPRIMRRLRSVPASERVDPGASGVFDAAQAATLLESDDQHWWFRAKGTLVATALRRNMSHSHRQGHLVDIGAGAGGVSATLGWKPDRLVSIDGAHILCRQARDRHALLATTGLVDALPLRAGGVSVATLLDVLEHLEQPGLALEEARRVLATDGLLVVNVPAHQWLWSGADELLGHVRRYTRPMLRAQLEAAGFEVRWMSHVFSWLVLPVWVTRRFESDATRQLGLHTGSTALSVLAAVLTRLERLVLRVTKLPIGSSILCVAVPLNPA